MDEREQDLLTYLLEANARLAEQTSTLNRENMRLVGERDDAVSRLDAIENATFWKMTASLRNLLIAIRGGKEDSSLRDNEEGNAETVLSSRERIPRKPLKERLQAVLSSDQSQRKKILFVSHELSLTEAPIALLYYVQAAVEEGYFPVVLSPMEGRLQEEFEKSQIPVLVDEELFLDEKVLEWAEFFDTIVLNTALCGPLARRLSGTEIPVLWWIHEGKASYCCIDRAAMPVHLAENISVYTVGSYARDWLRRFRPLYRPGNLLYCVPEVEGKDSKEQCFDGERTKTIHERGEADLFEIWEAARVKERLVFACVGIYSHRKGQDILLDAIDHLTEEEREECLFLFVGAEWSCPIKAELEEVEDRYPEVVLEAGELNRAQMMQLYQHIDCLIVPSRDDSMPIVATEAMMFGKTVICSEHTGTAALVSKEGSGLVYGGDDSAELAETIRCLLSEKALLEKYGKKARETYLSYFSKERFTSLSMECLRHTMQWKEQAARWQDCVPNVSVVIPTYNAGPSFEELLKRLRNQKLDGKLEIIVVDSGSRDETLALAQNYDAQIVSIPQESFSHSYARNLGSEAAEGEILLFMTQDALPMGRDWVERMIAPIVTGRAVATSAYERCPVSTDLFYKVASRVFSSFLGVTKQDQENSLYPEEEIAPMELRRRAQLTDVCCAIDTRVFRSYRYRYDFAEDLDMGVRLLRDGYTILLSGTVPVLHGHDRPTGYYLRRSLVDGLTLGKIIPELAFPVEQTQLGVRRILVMTQAAQNILRSCEWADRVPTCLEYVNRLIRTTRNVAGVFVLGMEEPDSFGDPILERVIAFCEPLLEEEDLEMEGANQLLLDVAWYLEQDVIPYLNENQMDYVSDEGYLEAIRGCFLKQMGSAIGGQLAKMRYNGEFHDLIQELSKGV